MNIQAYRESCPLSVSFFLQLSRSEVETGKGTQTPWVDLDLLDLRELVSIDVALPEAQ